MLNVSYLKTYGYVVVKREPSGKKYICKIHPANCLYATIWHDRQNKLAHLVDFFSDTKHLERCLKDNIFIDYIKIVIYTNTDFREKYQVAKLWSKYGFEVTLKTCKRWRRNAKSKKTISKWNVD